MKNDTFWARLDGKKKKTTTSRKTSRKELGRHHNHKVKLSLKDIEELVVSEITNDGSGDGDGLILTAS